MRFEKYLAGFIDMLAKTVTPKHQIHRFLEEIVECLLVSFFGIDLLSPSTMVLHPVSSAGYSVLKRPGHLPLSSRMYSNVKQRLYLFTGKNREKRNSGSVQRNIGTYNSLLLFSFYLKYLESQFCLHPGRLQCILEIIGTDSSGIYLLSWHITFDFNKLYFWHKFCSSW